MKCIKLFFVLLGLCALLTVSCSKPEYADLILKDGKIVTVDKDFSIREALAVRGDKIIFVGSSKEVSRFTGPKTRVMELAGKLVLPGLIDAHAHMNSLGNELTYFDINGATSFQQIIDKVAQKVKTLKPGEWIVGGRWDQNDWPEKRFPVHDPLSEVSPANPVYLMRIDGNAAFANQKALQIAGIDRETPDPFGGVIHRKAGGEASGVLVNRAMDLVAKHIPPESKEHYKKKILKAINDCLQKGLTGWHEAGVTPFEIEVYKELIDSGQLPMRVYAMLDETAIPKKWAAPTTHKGPGKHIPDHLEQKVCTFSKLSRSIKKKEAEMVSFFRKYRIEEYGGYFFSLRSIKLYLDGALGSRGAAFFEPYADDPGNTGLLRITPEYVYKVSKAAIAADMGVNTHCIGIRGNRLCLDAYEKAFKESAVDTPYEAFRFRIEHAQIVRDEDIKKFTALGVIPAMQPTHCTSDMPFVEARVGSQRAKGAYAWRSFIDAGLPIPCGSDFPVESNNPLYGIYAAITRSDVSGNPPDGWFPEQRMTRQEAIKGFTIWAAYGAFQEHVLGSIEKGKLADFTILDKDILTIEPAEILTTKVLYTIVGGKIRFRAGGGVPTP